MAQLALIMSRDAFLLCLKHPPPPLHPHQHKHHNHQDHPISKRSRARFPPGPSGAAVLVSCCCGCCCCYCCCYCCCCCCHCSCCCCCCGCCCCCYCFLVQRTTTAATILAPHPVAPPAVRADTWPRVRPQSAAPVQAHHGSIVHRRLTPTVGLAVHCAQLPQQRQHHRAGCAAGEISEASISGHKAWKRSFCWTICISSSVSSSMAQNWQVMQLKVSKPESGWLAVWCVGPFLTHHGAPSCGPGGRTAPAKPAGWPEADK